MRHPLWPLSPPLFPPLLALALLALAPAPAMGQGAVLAVGGGTEDYGARSDDAYGWFVAQASFGDIVVLAATPQSQWIPDYLVHLGAASAVNVIVPDRATAEDPEVAALVASASGVFIKGGDQSAYVRGWGDTALGAAIRAVFDAGGAVLGTSAGCAVLGDLVYDARKGSLQPTTALRSGAPAALSFTAGLFDFVPGVLFDTHFTERGRLPRLLLQLAYARAELGLERMGIGVDHKTALAIQPSGVAQVFGEGAVHLLRATPESTEVLAAGRAPSVLNWRMDSLTHGYVAQLEPFAVLTSPGYATAVAPPEAGAGPLVLANLFGHDTALPALGLAAVKNDAQAGALENGALSVYEGEATLGPLSVASRVWQSASLVENRLGGLLLALTAAPSAFAVALDEGAHLRSYPARSRLEPAWSGSDPEVSVLVIDGFGLTETGQSPLTAVGASSPRQSVALVGARVHLLSRASWLDTQTRVAHRR